MEAFAYSLIGFEGLFFLVCIVVLIVLGIQRYNLEEKEDFEDRDN